MCAMAFQMTSLAIVYFYLGADQRKHRSSASLAFVRGIHRWPMNSLHKGPVTRKMFPFDDVIINIPGCTYPCIFGFHPGMCGHSSSSTDIIQIGTGVLTMEKYLIAKYIPYWVNTKGWEIYVNSKVELSASARIIGWYQGTLFTAETRIDDEYLTVSRRFPTHYINKRRGISDNITMYCLPWI